MTDSLDRLPAGGLEGFRHRRVITRAAGAPSSTRPMAHLAQAPQPALAAMNRSRVQVWLPLRELRGFARSEQAFFRALADGDGPVRWTDVAADAGYADQSHLCRETRRVTGFAPAERRRRIAEDEGFWIYRVWT